MNKTLVCEAGGFIGSHLVTDLKRRGFWVRGIDFHYPFFAESEADGFVVGDVTDHEVVRATL
jgi:nucleoside-diphosphate-sugar epimerase